MEQQSIDAYDLPQRVASYDADMELMHPNRAKMVQIGLDVLPFSQESALRALDLGVGTGYFTERFLHRYPRSQVLAVDGARAMVDLAKARLGDLADRVEFCIADFRHLSELIAGTSNFDVVYSSYALHHLNGPDKETLLRTCLSLLRKGGWLLNADILLAESPEIEQRIQELRIDGILRRAGGRDPRFPDENAVRNFLDELERRDGDQPQTLSKDLQVMRRAGLRNPTALWLEYREAVCGGEKL